MRVVLALLTMVLGAARQASAEPPAASAGGPPAVAAEAVEATAGERGPPVAQTAPVGPSALDPPGAALERSGARQLGLALELPLIGVTSVLASGREAAFGYTLGAALSWELLPRVLVRGYGTISEAYGSRAPIEYDELAVRQQRPQEAVWVGWELGGGAAYLFRSAERDWTPYVGVDAAALFGGFDYVFASTDPLTEQAAASGLRSAEEASDVHEALEWSWLAGVRAGVRLSLLDWLATQAEISASYWPAPSGLVTNTYTERQVRSVAEDVWLVRTTFSVRLGL